MSVFGKKKQVHKTPDNSRQALIWMHPEALVRFMTSARWVIKQGYLPEDVEFHHCYYDSNRQVFAIVLTSSEFKSLKMGQKIPELPPIEFTYWTPGDGEIE